MEPKRQGAREARGGKEGKREFDRCERQRAEDAGAPSSCPRRTNLDRFPNVRPGSGSADPGIFGYFPSMESTSPGGEISPVLLRKSGPRDGQKANFKRRAGSSRPTAGRPYAPRTLHGVGNESNGAPGKAEGFVGERRSRKVSELSPFRRKRGIRRRRRRCRGGYHPPAGRHMGRPLRDGINGRYTL